MPEAFCFTHNVCFWETDAMGVSHHSNYLKYFEMARVAWLREKGLLDQHYPYADMALAVIESNCKHCRPTRFGETINIYLQVRRDGIRVQFQYAIYSAAGGELIATGDTVLVPINSQLRPTKLSQPLIKVMEQEKWIEIWP